MSQFVDYTKHFATLGTKFYLNNKDIDFLRTSDTMIVELLYTSKTKLNFSKGNLRHAFFAISEFFNYADKGIPKARVIFYNLSSDLEWTTISSLISEGDSIEFLWIRDWKEPTDGLVTDALKLVIFKETSQLHFIIFQKTSTESNRLIK